jgi:hypothetical protein
VVEDCSLCCLVAKNDAAHKLARPVSVCRVLKRQYRVIHPWVNMSCSITGLHISLMSLNWICHGDVVSRFQLRVLLECHYDITIDTGFKIGLSEN